MSEQKPVFFRPGVLLTARLVAAAALIALLAHFVPPQGVLAVLRTSSPYWLALAGITVFAWRVFAARRLREFTRAQGMPVRSARLFAVSLISSFFGTITPGYAVTGAVRWYLLSEAGRHKAGALAALFVDRSTDLAVMLGLGVCGLLLTHAITRPGLIVPALLLFAAMVAGSLVCVSPWFSALLTRLSSRLSPRLRDAACKLAEALGRFTQMPVRTRLRVMVLAVAGNTLNAFGMWCLMRALDLPLGYYDALWLRCAVFTVNALPITLMGLGVREVTLLALLTPTGIAAQSVVAFSLLLLARDLFAAAAGGLTLAFWRGPSPLRRAALQG